MKVRFILAAVGATLLIGAPASQAKPENANGGSSLAAKACAAEKKADKAAFKAVWGKHAMRDCIRAGRGEEDPGTPAEQAEEFANAAQECRAERDADAELFSTTYGSNGNLRNAFGKCVSSKVDEPEPETETVS